MERSGLYRHRPDSRLRQGPEDSDPELRTSLNALGDTYAILLKDDLQAVVAYRLVYQTDDVYKRSAAAMSVAAILARQNKLAEALLELETIDLNKVKHPYWRGQMLISVAPGANYRLTRSHIDQARTLIDGAALIVLQCEILLDTLEYILELAPETERFLCEHSPGGRKS